MQAPARELWKPQTVEARGTGTQADTQAPADAQGRMELHRQRIPKILEMLRPLHQGKGKKQPRGTSHCAGQH